MPTYSERYDTLLDDICAAIAAGRPPWLNRAAQQGPPLLARSGNILRGLPAVVAWHVADTLPGRPLAWVLTPPERRPTADASTGSGEDRTRIPLVLRLPANGGDAVYGATPHTRPVRIADAPPKLDAALVTGPALTRRLEGLIGCLGPDVPPIDVDHEALLSLAQAFLWRPAPAREPSSRSIPRSLTDLEGWFVDRPVEPPSSKPTPQRTPGAHLIDGATPPWAPAPVAPGPAWSRERLIRTAAWARLLADAVLVDAVAAWRNPWKLPPPSRAGHRGRTSPPPAVVQARVDGLRRVGWLQMSLPAEVRERAEDPALPPEQPLRAGILDARQVRRAPALGGLARHLEWSKSHRDDATIALEIAAGTNTLHFAALGLALADHLSIQPLPPDPALAWRQVGQATREHIQRGAPPPSMLAGLHDWAPFETPDTARMTPTRRRLGDVSPSGAWRSLSRHYLARAWVHPRTPATIHTLLKTGRWDRPAVDRLLRGLNRPEGAERPWLIRVKDTSVVGMASLRRRRHPTSPSEAAVLVDVAVALGIAPGQNGPVSNSAPPTDDKPTWGRVTDAVSAATWERQKRPKRSGGIRWLDVPSTPLKSAQRRIAQLLADASPPQDTVTAFHAGASPALHAGAHNGAVAAVHVDIADFFGSVHPWHLEPWLGLCPSSVPSLLPDWSEEGRRAIVRAVFLQRDGLPYLPQGAPSSPVVANLAGLFLDHAVVRAAREAFGAGHFVYTRYADDLVLSTRDADLGPGFADQALSLLTSCVQAQRWALQASKTTRWTSDHGEPLQICGLVVPRTRDGALTLDRPTWRRARAALHRLRHRLDFDATATTSPNAPHGLLAYAWSATGDLRWLAYTSGRIRTLAHAMAGMMFSEAFLAGWSDEGAGPSHDHGDRRSQDPSSGGREAG